MTGVSAYGQLFHEEQRFRQLWIWLLLGGITALIWYFFIQQVILGIQVGNNPAPDWFLILILVLFGIGFPLFFVVLRLEVKIEGDVFSYRMYPLHLRWRDVHLTDLSGAMAIVYRPLRDYGGWGIRFGRHGIAYTVSGNGGVLFQRKNGKSFLIGSQRAEEMEMILQSFMKQEKPAFEKPDIVFND